MMQSCNIHPGVNISWRNGDLGCPLCSALQGIAEIKEGVSGMVSREELEARTEWLKEERDAWRARAQNAEAHPGEPYNTDKP